MGLDMYFELEPDKVTQAENLITGKENVMIEIGYYRKFHALNNFIGELYPPELQEDFNCESLEIGWDELAAIKQFADNHRALNYDNEIEQLDSLCEKIELHLIQDRKVFYWPSW